MFSVKITTNEELIEILKELNKLGFLGEEICSGTYMPDADKLSDIIDGKINPFEEYGTVGLSISKDLDEYRNKNFPLQFGKNNISISINTEEDIESGDYFKTFVDKKDIINEINRL